MVTYEGGNQIIYTYDAAGNITSMTVLVPNAGDVDLDGNITLKDVILALQVLSGISPTNAHDGSDLNGDGKVGFAEALYILKSTAGLID